MSRKTTLMLAFALVIALVVALQACGKDTGNAAGGVTFFGAGS